MEDSVTSATLPVVRGSEVEERRVATRRLAWVGLVAWGLFTVTDFVDAGMSHKPEILPPLLALRATGIAVALGILLLLRRPKLSLRQLTACDVVFFMTGSALIALEGALLGEFDSPAVQGIMILCFMRASLFPSHWKRAFTVSALAALTFPATLAVAAWFSPAVRAGWFSPHAAGLLAYSLAQIFGGIVIGSAGSHMTWRARQQMHEARKLGSYRLKARIGSGATGDVWLAHQDSLGRDVALKVLKTRGHGDEDSRRRFAREAKAASLLRHPNTIRVFEFGASDDGVFFLAMELLDGEDLESLVSRAGPLSPSRAIHLALQACGSLAEAHAAGIVHRDIKPANLFVTHVGEEPDFLKLLDFGVAKMNLDRSAAMTHAGDLMGTPAYMAPEACNGETADARSDVYSLGAVLYFMLTGTEIFPDRTVAETLLAHTAQAPDAPSVRLKIRGLAIAPDLEAVVMRCLRKDPAERYAGVRALDEALRGVRDYAEPAGTRSTSSPKVAKMG